MGLRKYKRQIAKERLTALGVGNVNRQMGNIQDGMPNWRRALIGETGKAGAQAQERAGRRAVEERKRLRRVGT